MEHPGQRGQKETNQQGSQIGERAEVALQARHPLGKAQPGRQGQPDIAVGNQVLVVPGEGLALVREIARREGQGGLGDLAAYEAGHRNGHVHVGALIVVQSVGKAVGAVGPVADRD